MKLIYNIAIRVYYLLVFIVSFFDKKAKLWIDGRKNVFKMLSEKFNPNDKIAWFHCASLGEFEQTKPVLEAFKTKHPDYKILITFFSPSGYEIRKNYELADFVCYLPIDTPYNSKKFIAIVNPTISFMCKYDIWINYMNELHKKQTPTYLISASFRPNQLYFKWYGGLFLNALKQFSHIFTQNTKTVELLNQFNIQSTYTGDTRFDKVFDTAKKNESLELIEQFKKNENILILGSSWEKDENILIGTINKNCSENWKCIIAPHEIEKSNINRIEALLNLETVRYSEANSENISNARVLIIDSIGILAKTYKYAEIAYIGGAFGKGLHNILEPATFGLPVIFGPNYKKFPEASDLIKADGAFSISNSLEFEKLFLKLKNDQTYLKQLGKNSKNFVLKNTGSTAKIMKTLAN